MSSLEKLIISGIRSFSPDRREGIVFESPITLIVGQNGSGKTTIIECLKASITGELPPNSKSGQYFVHDPKLSDVTETRGQIRLIFRDYQYERRIQVVRSFQLSHLKIRKQSSNITNEIKSQFKVIESILQTKNDETGEITSISHKCADINSQVPILFGVSDSVIENVLFCHQEDSNWPLQEMSKVKKKFDDLFGSSRYSKALETISKIKNDYTKKIKEISLFNQSIMQKITFIDGVLTKKSACLKRKEEIHNRIIERNSRLKFLQEKIEKKEKNKEIIDKLFAEFSTESKLLDSYSNDIEEISTEINLSNMNKDFSEEIDIDTRIDSERVRTKLLIEKLETTQSEIQTQLQNINSAYRDTEFESRLDQVSNKIVELNNSSIDIRELIQELESLLSSKLYNFVDFDWNKYIEIITKTNFSHLKLDELEKLESELRLTSSEINSSNASLQQKREIQRELQRKIDQLSSKIHEKINIESEINNISNFTQELIETNIDIINFLDGELNGNLKIDDRYLQNIVDLYHSTYELGMTNGEISILQRLKIIEEELNHFEYDVNTQSIDEMISERRVKYKKKKSETLPKWRTVGNFGFADISDSKDFNVYYLKVKYELLKRKLSDFPVNLNYMKGELEEKLKINEDEISILENKIYNNEKKYKEMSNLIQLEKINKENLESEFHRKKDLLLNSVISLKRDFEYLFENREKFDSKCGKNENLLEFLKAKQGIEKETRDELENSKRLIDMLTKLKLLKRKKESYNNSKDKILSFKNEMFCLLGCRNGDFEKENYDIQNIDESYIVFKREINSTQNEIDSIQCEISRLKGENKVNEDWLHKCESDLKDYPDLESLKTEYSNGLFEHNLIISYIRDLDKYSLSLQKALMRFHVDKMSEINRTIKELWNITYKGHDIDYIAIRSDTENENETGSDLSDNSYRGSLPKSFNYRVVMAQNGVELEMKGRCSAGQKVLACIIIRLALAESFCLNCGILTLDEPTTNLDQLNIEGLAEALSYLIKFRKLQRNFQLIIITHDERFVRILAQAQQCDHFYQISKDEKGYSTIRQVDFHGY